MIAIVDDDALVRLGFKRLLRSAGYAVATYTCGADFLQSLERAQPACVVVDLQMPDIDGFEVLAALATRPRPIPALVVTAESVPEKLARMRRLGAASYLKKPVEDAALLQAIQAALDAS